MKTGRAFPIVLCAMFLGAAVRAEGDGPGGPGKWEEKREAHFKEMRGKLGLTPEQDKKLEAHRKAHREKAQELRKAFREKKEAMRAELEKPSLDTARLNALQAEVKALDNQLADHRLAGILEVRGILTPEQFKKFQELTREKREQWGKGGKGGRGARRHKKEGAGEP